MTEPSFPPELLREIGDLRRRVYELERRRQPPTDVMLKTNLRLEDLSDVSIDDTALADEDLVAWSDTFQVWRSLPFPAIPSSLDPALMPSVNFQAGVTSSSSPQNPTWTGTSNSVNSPAIGISGGKLVVTGGPHLFAVSVLLAWVCNSGTWTSLHLQALDGVLNSRVNFGDVDYFAAPINISGGNQRGGTQGSWVGIYTTGDIIADTLQATLGGAAGGSATFQASAYITQIV